MQYGIQLPQGVLLGGTRDPVQAYETMTHVAQTADECGYASIWLADHFAPPVEQADKMFFECWTTTAALARDTRRVRLCQAVTCQAYRNPALLAKMASTVDVLSHGRLTLGIGAGDYEQEFGSYGYQYPSASIRLQQLREAVQVLLAMWTQEEASFEGTYYQVHDAINEPKGVQHPHIPLLIGGAGEKVTLKLVAHYADVYDAPGDLATVAHKLAVLKTHCEAIGRTYASIHRTTRTMCLIADTDEEATSTLPAEVKALFETMRQQKSSQENIALADPATQQWQALISGLIGSPETIRSRIAAYEAAGVQELRLFFPDAVYRMDSIRRFAKEFLV